MNKVSKLIGVLSLSALATIGCKSEDPAPAEGTTGTTQQGNTGGQASCGTSTTTDNTGGQHSCGGAGHNH